jgi:hypothetical protein
MLSSGGFSFTQHLRERTLSVWQHGESHRDRGLGLLGNLGLVEPLLINLGGSIQEFFSVGGTHVVQV